jgi:hypothetical protein
MMQKLDNIQDKNPFKVPDNYFEEVNRKILSATTDTARDTGKISLYHRFRTGLLIAASVAGFFLISFAAIRYLTHDKAETQVSEILHEVNSDSYIDDIDVSLLEEDVSSVIQPETASGVENKDIIEYLLLENIELSEIYEQL